MKKYSKLIGAALIAVVFVGTFVFLYQKSQPKPVEYIEFTPEMKDILKTTIITGKIEPRDEVTVKPQISGIITVLYKEAGDMVNEGEVIAKVKVIPDMGQLSAAEARLRLADINAQQAQVDYTREENLYRQNLVSAEDFDKARQALKQAKEEVTAAQDALEVVRNGVSRSNADQSSTLIRSTISGIILDIPVKVGNTVVLSNTFNDGTTIATVAGALTYAVLYLSKSYFYSGLLLKGLTPDAALATVIAKLPATTFNAVVAVIFAPILAIAIRKALEENHISLK